VTAAERFEFAPPRGGRRYTSSRRVRLADVLASGPARLDAIARYLQDIASDDGREAAVDADLGLAWVVRRTVLELRRRPNVGEQLDLVTWASASGARWAERRTTVSAGAEPLVEAAAVWVCLDVATQRPARLPERFWTLYGDAVEDRTVSSRLSHPDVPAELTGRPWPLRLSDFDVMDHVNNAVSWAAVEEEADRVAPGASIERAELEYRDPIDRARHLTVVSRLDRRVIHVWLVADGAVMVSARLDLA
jgi:acyl-ACP thioesterase